MARVITFFPKQVYMGHGGASLVNLSDIFEITEENRLDLELRVYGVDPGGATLTGTIVTTSDPSFVDSAWKTVSGSFTQAGTGIATVNALTGFGRFVRAKLEVPSTTYACSSMQAVARKV